MNSKQNIVKLLNVLKDTYPKSRAFQAHDAVDRAIRIVDAVTSLTPALDWKPINITQMETLKPYLLWCAEIDVPDVGYMDILGKFYSSLYDTNLFDECELKNVTHYAEFNKPEGR